MAKHYRLEVLLKLKVRELKRAEAHLAKALSLLKEAREKLDRLEEEKKMIAKRQKESRRRMDMQMRGGGIVQEGCFHVNFLRKLKEDMEKKMEEIEEQKKEIQACEEKVAKARRDYIEAVKQLQVMEKHKALWKKKVAQEISKREEKEMDELGQTIHRLRQWRGEKSLFQI